MESIKIMRLNKRSRKYEYLVKCAGYDELSWQLAENLDLVEAIDDFHADAPTNLNLLRFARCSQELPCSTGILSLYFP